MVRESSVGNDPNNSGAAYMFGISAKRFIRLAIVLLKQLFFFSLLNFFSFFFNAVGLRSYSLFLMSLGVTILNGPSLLEKIQDAAQNLFQAINLFPAPLDKLGECWFPYGIPFKLLIIA
jgi:hypothetical protein